MRRTYLFIRNADGPGNGGGADKQKKVKAEKEDSVAELNAVKSAPATALTEEEAALDFLRRNTGNSSLTLETVKALVNAKPAGTDEDITLKCLRKTTGNPNITLEEVSALVNSEVSTDEEVALTFLREKTGNASLTLEEVLAPRPVAVSAAPLPVAADGGPMNDGRTLGEILINPSFNPSKDGIVHNIKRASVDLINSIDSVDLSKISNPLQRNYMSHWKQQAIDKVVAAQMDGVKAQTANFEKR